MEIKITTDEATGRITVESDGAEPYECQSPAECLDYVSDLLGAEPQGADETGESVEPDAATMWNEEASRRPASGLMR